LTVAAAATANYNAATATVYLDVLTASQQAVALTRQVSALVTSGTLTAGQGGALTATLSLSGNRNADSGQVNAFINQVTALQTGGFLTKAQADLLRARAKMLLVTVSLS
jgi:hypothetical protein